MDAGVLVALIQESLYFIVMFFCFFAYALVRGTRALTFVIFGLYIGLLLLIEFPYHDALVGHAAQYGIESTAVSIALFIVFTAGAALVFSQLHIFRYAEYASGGIIKKLLCASAAAVLITVISFHVLPIENIAASGTPIRTLFAPEEYFFWWLIFPLLLLIVVR